MATARAQEVQGSFLWDERNGRFSTGRSAKVFSEGWSLSHGEDSGFRPGMLQDGRDVSGGENEGMGHGLE